MLCNRPLTTQSDLRPSATKCMCRHIYDWNTLIVTLNNQFNSPSAGHLGWSYSVFGVGSPYRRPNSFSPPAHLCTVTCITQTSLHVTLWHQSHLTIFVILTWAKGSSALWWSHVRRLSVRREVFTFSTSPLTQLNGIQRNFIGSKISTSSTKLGFFGPIRKTRLPPWPPIGWEFFDFSSETDERNSTKLNRKQDLNVLYQVCVLWADRKDKMAALACDWLRHCLLLLWNR